MKFQGSIDIAKPVEVVTALFANPDYLKEYQDGFIRKELVSGAPGEDGAVSKMYYRHGKHEMELTETITANRLPTTFEAFYHHKHMDNTMTCRFVPLDEGHTRYESEVEYTRIDWIMPRLVMTLFKGMHRKHARKWMENFKAFAEKYEH